jgi:hypothetical protein
VGICKKKYHKPRASCITESPVDRRSTHTQVGTTQKRLRFRLLCSPTGFHLTPDLSTNPRTAKYSSSAFVERIKAMPGFHRHHVGPDSNVALNNRGAASGPKVCVQIDAECRGEPGAWRRRMTMTPFRQQTLDSSAIRTCRRWAYRTTGRVSDSVRIDPRCSSESAARWPAAWHNANCGAGSTGTWESAQNGTPGVVRSDGVPFARRR